MKKVFCLMTLLMLVISGCSITTQNNAGQYDELFNEKGEWKAVNSEQVKEALKNE
ncbi:hypothetical protein [Campylobacter helveticus]|uniref:hypothetical protein n=1 Tax=Campylobacter helveticus TaxID=28898 RepID=UPI0022EAD9E6|nr:hypothetical protein [Campylobacter helveticus]